MEVQGLKLEKRLHKERLKFFYRVAKHREAEAMIDFVIDNDWLKEQEKAVVSYYISTLFRFEITITVSHVSTDDFIKNVLGPYHLKYEINWEMEIEGDEDEPVIVFKEYNKFPTIHPTFRIKEGEFRVCNFTKKVIGFSQPSKARPIYKTEMVCE